MHKYKREDQLHAGLIEFFSIELKNLILLICSMFLLSSFTLSNTNQELEGIWIHQEEKGGAKTYLIVEGDKIQLYLEAYWAAGYNQYFSGDKLIANNSLIIHVEDYLTVSNNTGRAIIYRNCQKFNLQRLIIHEVKSDQLALEIIPGSSIYDSFGFFQDKIMNFTKLESEEFKKIDPIFHKVPTLLSSNTTVIKDCSAIKKK